MNKNWQLLGVEIAKKKSLELQEKYSQNPKKCKFCNSILSYKDAINKKKIFCNRSCAAQSNNKVKKLNKVCVVCNKKLKSSSKKYCSENCNIKLKKEITKYKIENNIKTSVNSIRKYLRENREHKCEICNNTEWQEKPIPLVMDHINGNASDNSLINLRLICPNCDRFLPTFGSKNRGKGRTSLGIKRK